jgi:tetratricopeptide (TPR) repeat protein
MRRLLRSAFLGSCLCFLPAAGLGRTPVAIHPDSTLRPGIPRDSVAVTIAILKVDRLEQIPASSRKGAFAEYVAAVRAALDSGAHDRALLLSQRATTFWKDLRRPLLHQAAAQLQSEQWGPAIESARAAAKARKDSMEPPARPDESEAAAACWEGLALYHTQRYDEALPCLRRAAAQAPHWAEAARALGEACFVAGRLDEACDAYARALQIDPRVGTARDLSYYAEARAKRGDLDGAIASMQGALQREPYAPGLHANLANLLRRDGERAEAYYHFTLELLLHGTDGRFALESLRATGDILEEMNKQPNDPERNELLLVSQGLAELRDGKTQLAVSTFQRAARLTRTPTLLPQLLFAEALLCSGNAAASRDQLTRILALDPGFVPALVLLADAQRALGEREQAQATVQRAYALFPTYWKLHPGQRSG